MMKTNLLCILGLSWLLIGCDREQMPDPAITFSGSTGCKDYLLKGGNDRSRDQDCISYSWVSGDTLKITHVNAGFNCCPEGFRTELKVVGDTLVIFENENSNMCDCNCLFDLKYYLTGISRDTWWIRVVEPYASRAEDKPIVFKAELRKEDAGEFCVTRTGYPWRI